MTADTVGGVWTYALELSSALQPHGVEVLIAAMGGYCSEEQRAEAIRIPNLRVIESAYRLEWMENSWQDVRRSGQWLLQLQQCFEPDLVHLNGYAHAVLPWEVPTIVVGHSCVLSWWSHVRGTNAPASWDTYRKAVRAGLQAAGFLVAPTESMLNELKHNYGSHKRSRVIPNACYPGRFSPSEKEAVILTAGRLWDEGKNVCALARVARNLSWPVLVAGEDTHPDHGGRTHIESVQLLGRLSRSALAAWLSRASIYVLPARYEPFGLSVLEAGLSGCALVLGDIPSLREVWGDAALFVDPDDDAALQDALETLVAEPVLRGEMAARAQSRAQQFSHHRMADGYLSVYSALVGSCRSPANRKIATASSL